MTDNPTGEIVPFPAERPEALAYIALKLEGAGGGGEQRRQALVGGGDRVGSGRLLAKNGAVQCLSQHLEHASPARASPTRRDDAGVAVGQGHAVVPAVERCGHRVQDRVGDA